MRNERQHRSARRLARARRAFPASSIIVTTDIRRLNEDRLNDYQYPGPDPVRQTAQPTSGNRFPEAVLQRDQRDPERIRRTAERILRSWIRENSDLSRILLTRLGCPDPPRLSALAPCSAGIENIFYRYISGFVLKGRPPACPASASRLHFKFCRLACVEQGRRSYRVLLRQQHPATGLHRTDLNRVYVAMRS